MAFIDPGGDMLELPNKLVRVVGIAEKSAHVSRRALASEEGVARAPHEPPKSSHKCTTKTQSKTREAPDRGRMAV